MKPTVPAQFEERFRKVTARLRVANERPVFTGFPAQEIPYSYTLSTQYSAWSEPVQQMQHRQYIVIPNEVGNAIYYADLLLDPVVGTIYRGFLALDAFPQGTPLTEKHYHLSSCLGGLFAALNGKIYQYAFGPWNELADLTDPVDGTVPEITLQAVAPDILVAAAVYAGENASDHCKLAVIENGVVDLWKGFLPKHAARPALAAVQTDDSKLHIYVDDWSGKKPLQIRRYAAGIWSAAQEILPMDALDDESAFSVGCATQLTNGRVILTGSLKRKNGPGYAVYMLGPEKFTFGRDLVVQSDYTKPLMVTLDHERAWAFGIDDFFCSPLVPGVFSEAAPVKPADITRFTLDMPVNGPDRLSLDVPTGELERLPEDLVPGAMLDLEVSANDQPVTLGRFGVDVLRQVTQQDGQSLSVDCSSYAMKKLMDWTSDTYFDYLGQGESHGDPGDLTRLVRFSGGSYNTPAEGGLVLDSLNEDGMLYTTVPASHGGFIRCKFENVQAADAMLGVGLNYGEETLAEAAARLGKKIEEVKAGERGRWAVLAVYVPDAPGAPAEKARILLLDYNTLRKGNAESPDIVMPYRQIDYIDVDRAGDSMSLAMQYQDGFARVYFANGSSNTLKNVLSATIIPSWELHPTEHENYGRGILFMRNNTGMHMSYPVMSDSDVIPLYNAVQKAETYGQPMYDATEKFPASNGTVQIDSERIQYTGLAGYGTMGTWAECEWVPGKVVAKSGDISSSLPSGTPTNFAQNRNNNYVLQSLTLTNGTVLNAVRVWVRKINFPEDGVTVSINQGSLSNAVSLVNNAKAYASSVNSNELSSEGGWVTFYLDRDVEINNASGQYWIMVRRSKNWTHPDSKSYFQFMKTTDSSYSGGGAYLFSEETDQLVAQGGDIAFVAYARVDQINKEYMFPVIWRSGLGLPEYAASVYWSGGNPTSYQDLWNGCAVTITSGAGKNNGYRIVRSFRLTDSLNDLFVFCLDRNPGKIFGADTLCKAVPAFYGLKRGQTSTFAAAHGNQSKVHIPRSDFAKAVYFEYYTADEDLTLAEVAEAIARKAGVLNVDLSNRHPGSITGQTSPYIYLPAISKNLIVSLDIPELGGGSDAVSVTFIDELDRDQMSVQLHVMTAGSAVHGYLTIRYTDWVYNEYWGDWEGILQNILSLPFDEKVKGSFRVSLYDGHISAWCGGRLLGAANMGVGLKDWTAYRVTASWDVTSEVKVMVPQAGTRVDNFVMDMGKTGAQLLSNLIGEKRVYYRDDGTGRLVIYTDREMVPGVYNRAIKIMDEKTDIGLATRVLLEGGEVVEVSDAGNLAKYGNFFKTFNFHEINNLEDAKYFADLVMEDMSLNRERIELEGVADPRIEPTDILTIQLPGPVDRQIVVDAVSHTMFVDESEAVYDMRLSGRFVPEEEA